MSTAILETQPQNGPLTRVQHKLVAWKEALLDGSRSNQLLYFKGAGNARGVTAIRLHRTLLHRRRSARKVVAPVSRQLKPHLRACGHEVRPSRTAPLSRKLSGSFRHWNGACDNPLSHSSLHAAGKQREVHHVSPVQKPLVRSTVFWYSSRADLWREDAHAPAADATRTRRFFGLASPSPKTHAELCIVPGIARADARPDGAAPRCGELAADRCNTRCAHRAPSSCAETGA